MAVYIDKELCKSCSLCSYYCPKNVFQLTAHVNAKGYNYMEAKRPELCVNCKTCEKICPDFAIAVT